MDVLTKSKTVDASSGTPNMSENVESVIRNYARAKAYHKLNYDNSIQNWRFYYAKNAELGMGQYAPIVAQALLAQGRQLLQYNVIKPTVDVLAGALLQMKFDPLFIPVNDVATSLTEVVGKSLYSDKELMDWDATWFDVVVGGLIQEGCCKIGVSDKYSELGNIEFITCLPGSTFSDPAWKTWRSSDCKRVWHEAWMTASDAMAKYTDKADLIRYYAKTEARDGREYGAYNGVTPFAGSESKWGSSYRFIEEYEVLDKKIKCAYAMTPNGDVQIPNEVPDDAKVDWLNANVPGWEPDYVYEKEETQKVSVCRVACPDLVPVDLLDNKPTEVQVGATPFKFWSASRFNGEPHSIVDSIKDAQQNINYWESLITHKIQTEGGGGAQFTDPEMFKDLATYEDYIKNCNNPRKKFPLKPGYMASGQVPVKAVVNSAFPQEAYAHLNHIISVMLPAISKVTPASLGRVEQGQRDVSSKLYEQMKTQSDAQSYTLHYGLKMFFNDVYEAYLMQAGQTYSNELIPRAFPVNGGKERIVVNERVELEDGTIGIKNDMRKLKELRHKVIISEKADSPAKQMENIAAYSGLLQALGQNPDKFTSISMIQSKIIENMPNLTPEDKEMALAIAEKELELSVATLEAKTKQAQLAAIQADMQIQQLMAPPPPPQVMPSAGNGGGMPQPEMNAQAGPQAMPEPVNTLNVPQAQGAPNG